MGSGPRVRGVTRLGTALAVTTLALAGCSGDDGGGSDGAESTDDAGASPSRTASSTLAPPPSTVDVPAKLQLTAPGTQLDFGQAARVTYEAEDRGTVLGLRVDVARKGSLDDFAGFKLKDSYQRKASYYYVRVTVRNLGEGRFGGVDVPLWGISGDNTLLPPVRFTSAFAPCTTEPLPQGFGPRDVHRTCLVFLSPDRGTLEGVSFRPTETYVPIEWHGEVRTPAEREGKRDRPKKSKGRG